MVKILHRIEADAAHGRQDAARDFHHGLLVKSSPIRRRPGASPTAAPLLTRHHQRYQTEHDLLDEWEGVRYK